MTEDEYKQEWLNGKHQTDYNACRFADNKINYCKLWIQKYIPWANINNPENIIDIVCLQKLKIASDPAYRDLCTNWSDKIAVNKLLDDLNFNTIKIPTYYSQYGNFTESAFNELPNTKLIIKCNHGSGWNLIIDKNNLTTASKYIVHKINEWLSLNYAYITGYEAQYENITPGVIIEPVLIDKPTDYGFWCVNGNIEGISLTRKLGKNLEEYIAFVNKDCILNDWYIGVRPAQNNLNKNQIKMVNAMIPYVQEIAKLFDFVRIDMYYINGKVYFGETTFTPCSGRLSYEKTES